MADLLVMYMLGMISAWVFVLFIPEKKQQRKEDVIDVYCVRCGKFMYSRDGKGVKGQSHGYCEKCIEKELEEALAGREN